MRRTSLFLLIIALAGILGFASLTQRLAEEDTTLASYLSGAILTALDTDGGGQEIRVNLHNFQIALYERGEPYRVTRIAAAGNPANGSRTPTGTFRILSKERSHTSTLSGVIMPWAMRFYRGYYFHDIPFWPNGEVIQTAYSAGCIRLSNDLAPEVYQWTRVGAKVTIYRSSLVREASSPTVYWLSTNGYRYPIASEQAFLSRGFRWSDVAIVPPAEIAALSLGEPLY